LFGLNGLPFYSYYSSICCICQSSQRKHLRKLEQIFTCWTPIIFTHTHTRLMALFSWTTWVSRYQKGKPIWILLKQGTVSSSGISWAICKSAPHSRQKTIPTPHHSVFTGRMPFLPPNQQC